MDVGSGLTAFCGKSSAMLNSNPSSEDDSDSEAELNEESSVEDAVDSEDEESFNVGSCLISFCGESSAMLDAESSSEDDSEAESNEESSVEDAVDSEDEELIGRLGNKRWIIKAIRN